MNMQQSFNRVWNHFIVNAQPFSVEKWDKGFIASYFGENRSKSPSIVLMSKEEQEQTKEFLSKRHDDVNAVAPKNFYSSLGDELDNLHDQALAKVNELAEGRKYRKLHNREFLRTFRKYFKYQLIAYAVKNNLEIGTEAARTIHAKRSALKWKK